MAGDGLCLPVLVILAYPRSYALCTPEGSHTAYHVHCGGTGKIVKTKGAEPTAAPDPVPADRIYESTDDNRIEAVGDELRSFCHGSTDNRCCSGTEYRLENQKCRGGKGRTILPSDKEVDKPNEGVGLSLSSHAKHEAKAKDPENRTAETEVHQVLHDDVSCILCPGEPRFDHGKTCLHEEDQHRAEQDPQGVYR
ncbi:hypothetical protein SDC9_92809 [bioreactor metagenome]|uniref:Uncharacterized protein n=1 Tax=bioreactor metagenome TaxID=1076179 RepID=A0A645A1J1_9ZZZZ